MPYANLKLASKLEFPDQFDLEAAQDSAKAYDHFDYLVPVKEGITVRAPISRIRIETTEIDQTDAMGPKGDQYDQQKRPL